MSAGVIRAALDIFRLLKADSVCHWLSLQKEAVWLLGSGGRRLFLKLAYQGHWVDFTCVLTWRSWGRGDARYSLICSPHSVPPTGDHTLGRLLCSSTPILNSVFPSSIFFQESRKYFIDNQVHSHRRGRHTELQTPSLHLHSYPGALHLSECLLQPLGTRTPQVCVSFLYSMLSS